MGLLLKAKCHKCDFQKSFNFGAGKMNYKKISNVPAINIKTGDFVLVNYLDKNIKSDFNFYNQVDMFKAVSESKHFSWQEFKIQRSNNLCPKCKKFEMEFILEGYFD